MLIHCVSDGVHFKVNALTKRYNHLLGISVAKECGINLQPIPDFQKTDY